MKTVRFLAMLWLPFLVAGCVSDVIDEGSGTGQNGEIRFEIGFADRTRVATGADFTSAWEVGDEIGIFAVATGSTLESSGNYIHNAKLTYDNGTWTPAEPQYWPQSGKLDFYAYYPYQASPIDPTAIAFSVSADQSLAGAFGASDLLASRSDNGGAGWAKGSTVALTFTHSLALVQVDITDRGVAVPEYDAVSLTVKMHGVQTSATLDLGSTGGAAVAGGNAGSVVMTRVDMNDDSKWIYRALVPSQTVASGAVLFSFEQDVNGNGDYDEGYADFRFVYCPSQAQTLAVGEYTEFDIETNWDEGNYSPETRRFIRWAQETNDWQSEGFTLFADIDLTGYDWKPVGDYTTQFMRTFDGGGHSITGLSVNSGADYVGLFGYVGIYGEVRNVTVSGTVTGTSNVGGIVGRNSGPITGCSFSGTVTGTGTNTSVGGIVGYNFGITISGCSVSANSTIEVTGTNEYSRVGGIVGSNSSSPIIGCTFSGTVTGNGHQSEAGGIAGFNSGSYGTITGCLVGENSTIEGIGYVGGIAGVNYCGTITGSWSAARSVTGSSGSSVGGIAGKNSGDNNDDGTIRYCHWLWNNPTGFSGNAVGYDEGITSDCASFATVAALNMLIPDMNTAITAAGITDWQWVEGADPTTDWPTIEKMP